MPISGSRESLEDRLAETGGRHGATKRGTRVGVILVATVQLVTFAFQGPAIWVAQNSRSFPNLAEATQLSLLALVGAFVLLFGLQVVQIGRAQALAVTSVGLLIIWNWQSIARPLLGLPSGAAGGLISLLLLLTAYLQGHRRFFRMALFATGATLFVIAVVTYLARTLPSEPSHIFPAQKTDSVATQARRPDVYLLVLDGYGRADVLDRIYGYDNKEFVQALHDGGFDVATAARSNYSITHFSLSSLLEMRYLMEGGNPVSRTDLQTLRSILAGDNATVRLMRSLGYEYIQGPSAWWGTECSKFADLCLPSPRLGRTAYELLVGTPLRPLVYGEYGDVDVALTLKRRRQFRDSPHFNQGFAGPAPDFVFVHMPIPHPPLFLDSSCTPRLHVYAQGRILNDYPSLPGTVLDWRREAFAEQTQCANAIATDLIAAVPEDAAVIIVSDHGPDSNGQLKRDPESLDPDAIQERLSVLTAVRLPADCPDPIADDAVLVNLMPLVANCLFGTSIGIQEPRFFLAPTAETTTGIMTEVGDPDGE